MSIKITTNNKPVQLVDGWNVPDNVWWSDYDHTDRDSCSWFQVNRRWYHLEEFSRIRTREQQAQQLDHHAVTVDNDSPVRLWGGYETCAIEGMVIRFTEDLEGVIIGRIRRI